VNAGVIKRIFDRCNELESAKKHDGSPWVGYDEIRKRSAIYLEQARKWAADKRAGRPRFPSMFAYDSKGRPHRSGVGSDNGQVSTYFDAQGRRVKFAVDFIDNGPIVEWHPEWSTEDNKQEAKDGIFVDNDKGRVECLICNHTEKFQVESRKSLNLARGRMSKHLRSAKDQQDAHRQAHTLVFG
jgi:hypothetical protein